MRRFIVSIGVVIAVVAGLGSALRSMPLAQEKKESQEQNNGDKEKEKNRFADQMPEGEGKAIAVAACSACHSLVQIVASRKDTKAWARTIDKMISEGAALQPDETDTLLKYLAANFGPFTDLNKEGAADLATLLSIDKKLAEAIVRYREKNGKFEKIEDVGKVEGMSAETLQKIKDRIMADSTKQTKDMR